MNCTRCGAELIPNADALEFASPVTYQFDNVVWIGFHGGYGMFVDNLDATMANNTADQWERDDDGEYLTWEPAAGGLHPVPNINYVPTYNEERTLPGQPDYEAVICHDCAHELCAKEPWLGSLLNPYGSHAHHTEWMAAHPDHWGWDYDRARAEDN